MFSLQSIPLSVRSKKWQSLLFSQEEIESLLDVSIDDFLSFLQERNEKECTELEDVYSNVAFLYSRELEYIKSAILISSGSVRLFLQSFSFSYEIENLKILVRMLLSKKISRFFYPQYSSTLLSFKKILDVTSIQDLQLYFESHHSFSQVLSQTIEEMNTLYWELSLDNFYLSKVLHAAKFLNRSDFLCVKKLVFYPILYQRIVLVYRLLFHYNVNIADVLTYVPCVNTVISEDDWSHLISMSTSSEFFECLFSLQHISDPSVFSNAFSLSSYFSKKIEATTRSYLGKQFGTLSPFLSFIQLKKIEDQKLSAIFESKSLSVSKSDVMKFL